ncbi:MAG: hypothetical protein FWD82_01105 [Defluviitaleaceae bacterium]|nr:hypothetical protein [Defluviitaleaceae bacterium]
MKYKNYKYYKRYANVRHKVPYIYEINNGEYSLYYYGTNHTNNAEDSVFNDIPNILTEFKPRAVIVEGVPQLNVTNENKFLQTLADVDIKNIHLFGENLYAAYMGYKKEIEVFCPEPPLADEVKIILTNGFSLDEIFVYYMCRFIYQWKTRGQRDESLFNDYLENGINYFNSNTEMNGILYSNSIFFDLFYKIFGMINFEKLDESFYCKLLDPVPRKNNKNYKKYGFNKISRIQNDFRDQCIISETKKILEKYKKVLIVFGATHAYMQRKEIELLMNRGLS